MRDDDELKWWEVVAYCTPAVILLTLLAVFVR